MDVCLVLDIGKSNKKLSLYDARLEPVYERQAVIPEVQGEDGLICDDLPRLVAWLQDECADLAGQRTFRIRAVNATTFGATVVHLGQDGTPVLPVLSYTNSIPDAAEEAYFALMDRFDGGLARFATPRLPGLLIVGKQLFWLLREHAARAARVHTTLFLPQYLIYLLTGRKTGEKTGPGCHSGLWDFADDAFADEVVQQMGWHGFLPEPAVQSAPFPVVDVWRRRLHADADLAAGPGVHDSSSALLPFVMTQSPDYVFLSTGTWIVAFNPSADFALDAADMRRDRLYYLTPEGRPVRAARLFAGREHALQLERIEHHFACKPDTATRSVAAFLPEFFREQTERGLVPSALRGSGPFPASPEGEWRLAKFASAEEAYARLCLDLAVLTGFCVDSVAAESTKRIIVDGGFVHNRWFMEVLAMLQAPAEVFATEVPSATSLGAALQIHAAWAPAALESTPFALSRIESSQPPGLRIYAERFLARMAGEAGK